MAGPESDDKKTQSLTIYLIKEEFSTVDEIIKPGPSIKKHPISYDGEYIGDLYVEKRFPRPPKWAKLFEECLDIKEIGNVATTSGVLIIHESNRIFAITFDQGWHHERGHKK